MDTSDVMIHIDGELDDSQRAALENGMLDADGVIASRFNKPHLLMVSFDPVKIGSKALLQIVQEKGHAGQLVGL